MIHRLKALLVALSAVAVLGAVVAATTASASVYMLPETEEAFSGKGGKGTLAVLPGGATHEVTAVKETAEGKMEGSSMLGPFHIMFEEAKAGDGLLTCTGLDESSGIILVLGTYHLVYIIISDVHYAGILFLVEPTHFECSTKLYVTEGQVLCLMTPTETLTKTFTIKCEGSKGDPKETVYFNEANEEVKMGEDGLKTAENEGTAEMSSEMTEATVETTKEYLLMV